MFNPLEFKHDIASRPLKFFMKGKDDWNVNQAQFLVMAMLGFETAAVNLMPAVGLIHSGIRGERLFSHVSYVRFNPWAKPIFHYTQAASRAERIGGAFGKKVLGKAGVKVGARVGGRLIPGVGWALLAYDVYDIVWNRSLWGFDF